ncbi:MAG: PEPxxWA-CTERM sorting domain-containing protein [Pseudomonadota bacterium]
MKKLFAVITAAWLSLMLAASPASAATEIFEATNFNGGSGKHGLWTNTTFDKNAFTFQNDVIFTVDRANKVGSLTGTAINKDGLLAEIDISLSGFLDKLVGTGFKYKEEQGVPYSPASDDPDLDFFSKAVGSITINGTVFNLSSDPFRHNTVFQFGKGANAKNPNEHGASAWINIDGQSKHWDFNFAMSPVPEPATWLMMILGLALVGGALRSQTARKGALARA